MVKRFCIGLLLLAFTLEAAAQGVARYVSDGGPVRRVADPGDIIIEFAAAPLLSRDGKAAADLDLLFERLQRDLAAIERDRVVAKSGAGLDPAPVLHHRYTRAFAGASTRVSAESVDAIRRLSYVRSVHPDRVVSALLHESVDQVGARAVWQEHGARGEGVVVAVIDSGIDYTHPAFGGGFGPGHKVQGGRDFVNDDGDPMDDNGHGTHVAGIVAANGGGLTGVAPDATLLAFKALDQSGSGRDSFVLAAIEEAARLRPDIVNMSLGRAAAPDDPVVKAIENAAAAGILFCVAAGNSGRFLDIGSPGNAPSAITVGAIDREGRLAPFSTKGPVIPTGAMKPEISAPGVQIVSARNGGGTRTASGTSMAAPHVAGVAALLRDIHPDWSMSMLRSALINSARPIDGEVMAVGAGAVHAGDAVRKDVFPLADTLSFGISDQTQQPWSVRRTVTLTNLSDGPRSLALTVEGLRDGIEVTPSSASISIEPGSATSLDLELRLDHSKVPSPEAGSLSFGGLLRFTGDGASVAIPWSFVKASKVRVRWTGSEPATVRLATDHMIVAGASAAPLTSRVDLFIGAGDVTLWAHSQASRGTAAYHIIREHLDVSGTSEIVLDPSHAPHRVRFAGADIHGRLLGDRGKLAMRDVLISHPHFDRDLLESLIYLPPSQELFLSPLSSTTTLLAFERAFDSEPAVTWSAQYEPVSGIDRDVDLTIAPGAWKSLSASGIVPSGLEHPYQSIFAAVWISMARQLIGSIARPDIERPPIASVTAIDAWVTSSPSDNSTASILVEIGDAIPGPGALPLENPELIAEFVGVEGGIVGGHDRTPRISARVIPSQEPISIGEGPAYPQALIASGSETMFANIQWSGPVGEDRICDAKRTSARLYDSAGTLVASAEPLPGVPGLPFGPSAGFQMFSLIPAPGRYTLEASTSSFSVGGLPARGTLRAAFDSGKSDAMPPALTSLRINDGNGRTTATLKDRANATLTFSTVDLGLAAFGDIRRDATSVRYRTHGAGDDSWSALTPAVIDEDFAGGLPGPDSRIPDGVLYRVSLGDAGPAMHGAIDVRIHVEDAEGNSVEYTIEPAFVIPTSRRRAASQP